MLGEHEGVLRRAVTALKYGREPAAARAPALLLARRLALEDDATAVDLVVPVPLAPERLSARGFNQAELLARDLPRALGAAWGARAMTRRRGRGPQVGRTRAERRRLSAAVFRARATVAGRSVLVVDDVVTTGATLRAASRALRRAGARRVFAAAITRAP